MTKKLLWGFFGFFILFFGINAQAEYSVYKTSLTGEETIIKVNSPKKDEVWNFDKKNTVIWEAGSANDKVNILLGLIIPDGVEYCDLGTANLATEKFSISINEKNPCQDDPYTVIREGKYKIYLYVYNEEGSNIVGESNEFYILKPGSEMGCLNREEFNTLNGKPCTLNIPKEVKITVQKKGNGPKVKIGDEISINFTVSTDDGTILGSTPSGDLSQQEPQNIVLGDDTNHIGGFNVGVIGMNVGEKRRIEIDSEFAMGAMYKDYIPETSKIIFEIEVVGIIEKANGCANNAAYNGETGSLCHFRVESICLPGYKFDPVTGDVCSGANDGLAAKVSQCLKDKGAILYGESECPYCQKQKEIFENYAGNLPYVECSVGNGDRFTQTEICQKANIQAYPTWIFRDGTQLGGPQSLATLSKAAGCEVSATPIRRTLKRGVTGDDVKALQTYLQIEADGIYGQGTTEKVKEWQRKNGLTADGNFGEKSRQKAGLE